MENVAASPFRFDIEPHVLLRTVTAIEDRGDDVGAIYHSHTRSAPYPSQTDVELRRALARDEWLIVGLAGDEPEVRHFRIEDGRVAEVELVVDG